MGGCRGGWSVQVLMASQHWKAFLVPLYQWSLSGDFFLLSTSHTGDLFVLEPQQWSNKTNLHIFMNSRDRQRKIKVLRSRGPAQIPTKQPGGVLNLSLGRGVPPGPWNPDPVYDKKSEKILKNWYPVYDFQAKFHSFFRQNAWVLDPVYKISSKNLWTWDPVYEQTVEKPHPEGRHVPV